MKGSPCHRCKYGVADKDGKIKKQFENLSYYDLPCSACELIHGTDVSEDNDAYNSYRSKVSIETLTSGSGEDFDQAEKTGWGEERDDWTDSEKVRASTSEQIISLFADFVRFFISMSPENQRIVSFWLLGFPLRQAGIDIGMTPQGVSRRLNSIKQKFPILNDVKKVVRRK